MELANAFLDLANGYDVPVGSVLVLSSASMLLRVGPAAYADAMVRAFARVREVYKSSVRVVHGFPVLVGGVENEVLVRSLLDIDLWLSDTDKKRNHSLADTSAHYTTEWYRQSKDSTTPHSTYGTYRIPYSMPHALHTTDKGPFTSPGWEDVATRLPPLQEEDESRLVGVLIEELNNKFALQLDLQPLTDRSGQEASDRHDPLDMLNVVFAGGSHSSRILDTITADNVRILDATVPGFRLTERSAADMASEIADICSELPSENTVVVCQLFDNSIYYGAREEGEKLLPKKGLDRRYHIEGHLRIVNRNDFRELFLLASDIIRAADGKLVILQIPLPRYLLEKCCTDPGHIVNKYDQSYEVTMRTALTNIASWLRSMLDMKRMKNVVLYNPMDPLGLTDDEADEERILSLWGADPVHPTEEAYAAISNDLLAYVHSQMAESRAAAAAATEAASKPAPVSRPQKPVRRESWIASSEPVAKRQNTGFQQPRGGRGYNRGGQHRGGYHWSAPPRGTCPRGGMSRGGRGPWKRGFKGRGGRGGRQGRH
jgi:hypothetical protein